MFLLSVIYVVLTLVLIFLIIIPFHAVLASLFHLLLLLLRVVKSRTAWRQVNLLHLLDVFRFQIKNSLPTIPSGLLSCCNPVCADHHSLLDDISFKLCSRVLKTACPSVNLRVIPAGWNDAARMLKSKANFWHNIWREAGSPATGVATLSNQEVI